MNIQSLDQIKQNIVDNILSLRKDIRIVSGDTEYDVVVESTAPQFYRYEVLLAFEDRTRNLTEFTSLISDTAFQNTLVQALGTKQDGTPYQISDVQALISARLDAYVADWDIPRSPGTAATGFVTIFLSDSSPVSWNSNTHFTSATGATYAATSAISNVVPNFDTTKGLYFVTIPVTATTTGQATNAVAGAVNAVTPKPASFSYCTNQQAINGGLDSQTDLDVINDGQQAWANRVNGSVGALEQLALAQAYVSDALALNEDDETTGVFIGSVCDIFTQFNAEDTQMVSELFYWPGAASNPNSETFSFTPSNQPLISSVPPVVFAYDGNGNPVQVTSDVVVNPVPTASTAISVVKDRSTYSESVKAGDKIQIKMPLNTDTITITDPLLQRQRKLQIMYLYDKSSYKLQALVDDPANRMVGPQALVRKAVQIPLRVIVEPAFSFGYDPATVEQTITDNISVYFNGGTTSYGQQFARKAIGQPIAHSDISTIILRTAGVVSYDTETFYVINTVTGDLSDPTTIVENQYASLFDVLFEFNTFNLSNFSASF